MCKLVLLFSILYIQIKLNSNPEFSNSSLQIKLYSHQGKGALSFVPLSIKFVAFVYYVVYVCILMWLKFNENLIFFYYKILKVDQTWIQFAHQNG